MDIVTHVELSTSAISALAVPFSARSTKIDIGSIGYAQSFELPIATYLLTLETLPPCVVEHERYDFVFNLRFVPVANPNFAILKRGGEVNANQVLLKTATRA